VADRPRPPVGDRGAELVPLYERRGYRRAAAERAAANVLGRLRRKGFVRAAGAGDEITRSGKRAAQ
jgi:hypothetical protein